MADSQGSWVGQPADQIDIQIDIDAIAKALIANDDFIRKLAEVVRNQMLRQARPYQNVFGKYAGGPQTR
jgi:hypothetical protein